ncbi:hypothetical protein Cob_v011316 [Colletotrichum orbiculare MAFF 240422]|uniref:Uncharacterized protein n=1 Tax=Colletotrichum orbiculare (strain 104-T / ATCC 96160 / CBS 514.97 / LARS 414 / MAFF 240422) TaxID=1213857 RepID=A0A484FGC9_COLOR|nr:hypothetical protein Cob_v011316 [Colletotrichum orbiculare MAFF 240422]
MLRACKLLDAPLHVTGSQSATDPSVHPPTVPAMWTLSSTICVLASYTMQQGACKEPRRLSLILPFGETLSEGEEIPFITKSSAFQPHFDAFSLPGFAPTSHKDIVLEPPRRSLRGIAESEALVRRGIASDVQYGEGLVLGTCLEKRRE